MSPFSRGWSVPKVVTKIVDAIKRFVRKADPK